jgi:hypothetical protein
VADFATSAELADFLGRESFTDPVEVRQAALVLKLASGEIRAWTRQTIDYVANDTIVLAGSYGPALRLPEQPVVSVSSVKVDDQTLAPTDYTLACGTLFYGSAESTWGYQGASTRQPVNWGGPDSKITVVYAHGFQTVPDVVKLVTLSLAARMYDGIGPGVHRRSETIAGWSESTTYVTGAQQGALNDAEMQSLRYLRRTW